MKNLFLLFPLLFLFAAPVNAAEDKAERVAQAVENTAQVVEEEARATTEAVAQNATTLTEFSVNKLEQFFSIAEDVMQKYGGEAVDLGLNVLRIDALSRLLLPFVGVVVSIILIIVGIKYIIPEKRKYTKQFYDDLAAKGYGRRSIAEDALYGQLHRFAGQEEFDVCLWSESRMVLGGIYGVITIIIAICSVINLLNIWYWIGIFYPEIYAVYKYIL